MSDQPVPEVDVSEAARLVDGGAPLIDVREPDEYEEVRARAAALIPLSELTERVAEVPTTGPVYLICRSGARSARAAEYLRAGGVDAVNVAGGTLAWVEAGLPTARGPVGS